MKKQKTKTKRPQPKPASSQVDLSKPEETTDEDNKPFDFGGLPARDLKKNLGCG